MGVLAFGVLSFAGAYAFAYWGIERVPAGAASVLFASVPLVTFVAAVAHRLEPFRWPTMLGALLALGGIALMVGGPSCSPSRSEQRPELAAVPADCVRCP